MPCCPIQDATTSRGSGKPQAQVKSSPVKKQPAASQTKPAQEKQKQPGGRAESESTSPTSSPVQAHTNKAPLQAAKQGQQTSAKAVVQSHPASLTAKQDPASAAGKSTAKGQLTKQDQAGSFVLPSSSVIAQSSLERAHAASKPRIQPTEVQPSIPKVAAAPTKAAKPETSAKQAAHIQTAPKQELAGADEPLAAVTDEWADKAVPMQSCYLQSGYHMSDSPLPEDEELGSERETSRPPSAERQQPGSADSHSAGIDIVDLEPSKAAASNAGVTAPLADTEQHKARSPPRQKVLLPAGMDDAADSAGRLRSTSIAAKAATQPKHQPIPKPVLPATTAAVAADSTVTAPLTGALAAANGTAPKLLHVSKHDKPPQPVAGLSRLSVSSSKARPPTESSRTSNGNPTLHDPSIHASPDSQAHPAETVTAVKPSKSTDLAGKAISRGDTEPSKPKQRVPPEGRERQPVLVSANAAQPKPAASVSKKGSLNLPLPLAQPPTNSIKPPAPRQSSAALSGKPPAPLQTPAAAAAPESGSQNQSSNKVPAQPSPPNASKPQHKQTMSSAVTAALQGVPAVQPIAPVQPESKSQAGRRKSLTAPLQASPQDPPIPGLASPEGPVVVQALPSQAASQLGLPMPSQVPVQTTAERPSPPAPPQDPLSAPPQGLSDPLPPEPSSPRPTLAEGQSRKESRTAQKGRPPPSDSGEDMDIDQEPARQSLPPLPTEPFPQGLELATFDPSQELMEISSEEKESLLTELTGIHVRLPLP